MSFFKEFLIFLEIYIEISLLKIKKYSEFTLFKNISFLLRNLLETSDLFIFLKKRYGKYFVMSLNMFIFLKKRYGKYFVMSLNMFIFLKKRYGKYFVMYLDFLSYACQAIVSLLISIIVKFFYGMIVYFFLLRIKIIKPMVIYIYNILILIWVYFLILIMIFLILLRNISPWLYPIIKILSKISFYILDKIGVFSIFFFKKLQLFLINLIKIFINKLELFLTNLIKIFIINSRIMRQNFIYSIYKLFSTKMVLTSTVFLIIFLCYLLKWIPDLYIDYEPNIMGCELESNYLNISNCNTEIINIYYFLIFINIIHIFIACYSLFYDYFLKNIKPIFLYIIMVIILFITTIELNNIYIS